VITELRGELGGAHERLVGHGASGQYVAERPGNHDDEVGLRASIGSRRETEVRLPLFGQEIPTLEFYAEDGLLSVAVGLEENVGEDLGLPLE